MSKKLPQGWKEYTLKECTTFLDGLRKPVKEQDRVPGPYPYYGANGVQGSIDSYIFDEELVLLAEDGGHFGSKEKPIAYMIEGRTWVNNHAHVLRANKDIITTKYLCKSLSFYDVTRYVTGSTRLKLTKGQAEKIILKVPPLEEQERIVSILEKAEEAIQKREESNRLLDELVKSRFIEMFGDPVSNPNEWEIKSFNEVFDISSSSRILKSEWKSEGIPFYRVRDMVKLSECGVADNEFFVSEEFYSSLSSSKGTPQVGDIMVSATSTIGKCYVVKENERFYYKDADVLRFRKKIELSAKYFIHFMKTQFAINQIKSTFGVTTVPHFTIVNAKKINMPYPPFELQNEFAGFVNLVDQLKFKMENSLKELENNFNSLMQKAFNGEL